ncbi:DUF5671 domain-containing protein [Fundidesulfovibrio agrisoli]|uniref:DUF5671 domain-containing protein n=1 Tax=Fundidesulfovibrio agrisoli TaxID=2922717 RepID=UPI001FAD2592|nr:DUF5671 domain-containing protein [Fundidesulfovibrio agrisoli]
MQQDLVDFTRKALERGIDRERIVQTLLDAGWNKADVASAMASYAPIDFPVPVPRPRPYLSASEVFLHLLMFASLYYAAFSLGAIAFQFIDHSFPDPASMRRMTDFRDAIRWNVSALLISFPLFAAVFRSINKTMAENPSRRQSRPRRWLTYMTLFIGAVVIAGDLIALVHNALGGELTSRFILKVATVMAIAGSSFLYFLTNIRKEEAE